ncbi:hypothetical protein [Pelomonas sp. SE-A7]|uniref:hypothetical protein n=1 Tax=Pelomonas sp. SE-A7 TaxID=3054953 RepID=UPI00259CE959|nr:hypothetical protein [Pelomonas sp. SE-A7]MDM4765404.1 hypothetical protein [Pelomonas sp. SE-A7]
MKTKLIIPALLLACSGAFAHDGDDHGAAPAAAAGSVPRVEAHSELFELVARLQPKELSLLIDRYASNEPLLQASVEVESGGRKAKAAFHAEHGDYSIEDPALLKLLATPGEHALVITVIAGSESDLLDGVLKVGTPGAAGGVHAEHGDAGGRRWWWALLALPLLGGVWIARKRGGRA